MKVRFTLENLNFDQFTVDMEVDSEDSIDTAIEELETYYTNSDVVKLN